MTVKVSVFMSCLWMLSLVSEIGANHQDSWPDPNQPCYVHWEQLFSLHA